MIPVESATLIAFVVAAGAIVVSPGPDTMLILRYSAASGHKIGLAAVAGVQLGLLVHTGLAVSGVSLIIIASPPLFRLVAVAGAIYLGWLGIQGVKGAGAARLDGERAPVAAARVCRDALVTNLLNPKVLLLFFALFPNFVDVARGRVAAQLLTLAGVLIAVNLLWQVPLAWAAAAVRRWLAAPAVAAGVARATGAVLLGFAALLLYEHAG